jgi:hypothetical protein
MVKNRYGWVVILLLFSLIVVACGGGSKSNSGPTASPESTAEPTSAFPPTWTPAPTLTSAPRATIEYTYEPPTEPPTSPIPTRLPATLVPGETPATGGELSAPNTLTLTAEKLNELLVSQFVILTSYLKGIPDIQFQEGLVRVEATVYTTPGDANSARLIVIEAGATVENGIIRLSLQQVYFADDNSPYEDALGGYLLGTVETGLNDLVRQLYLAQVPDGSYVITGLNVTSEGVVVNVTSGE